MKTVKILFYCHIAALIFGLAGLLIALPHPELWEHSPALGQVFAFGMRYAGSLHILFGAATMLCFGFYCVGARKTLIFFAVSALLSCSMELLGTSTGIPFGPYAYTDFLGYKILDHVPFPIPLSWFYMGFTSYLLANLLVTRVGWRRNTLWSLLLGAYFLTVWDLSLDPAMASPRLLIHFWIWSTSGPYFGMPISNLVGWALTGLAYMSLSRLLWRGPVETRRLVVWLPLGMYVANTGFAIALTLGVGLWQPLLVALLLGLLPASLVLWPSSSSARPGRGPDGQLVRLFSRQTIRLGCALLMRDKVTYRVEGGESLPPEGPVLIVARHFHHFYDGGVLLNAVPRPLHLIISLDWLRRPVGRWLMEGLCTLAEWPIVLRSERLSAASAESDSVYRAGDLLPYLRRAVTLIRQLLKEGEALVIFPEAYPAIDPHATPRADAHAFLAFRPGFARLLQMVQHDEQQPIPVVPAGLHYEEQSAGRWQVTLRFGQPRFLNESTDLTTLLETVEQDVHRLSAPEATQQFSASFPSRQETPTL